jgi:lipopolysaccharide export system protein LptA
MNRLLVGLALILCVQLCLASPCTAAAERSNQMVFKSFSVEGEALQGSIPIEGPLTWSGDVVVQASGMTMTCDRVKVWLPEGKGDPGRPAAGGDMLRPERAEASGNLVIEGRRRDSQGDEWDISGTAGSVTYGRGAGTLVLAGSIDFKATNRTTGAVVTLEAAKLTYDLGKRTFRLDRGDQRVRMQWQEPEPEPGDAPAEQQSGESDTD